jgi:hypothetical protein
MLYVLAIAAFLFLLLCNMAFVLQEEKATSECTGMGALLWPSRPLIEHCVGVGSVQNPPKRVRSSAIEERAELQQIYLVGCLVCFFEKLLI